MKALVLNSGGKCGTRIDRLAAFETNGVKDPIEYE